MSKVYEDGIERNPTADEQVDINRLGGGRTAEYVLVKTIEVTGEVAQISSNVLDGYDDIIIEIQNIKGTDTGGIWFTLLDSLGNSKTPLTISNFIKASEYGELFVEFTRRNEFIYKYEYGGKVSGRSLFRFGNIQEPKLEDKIKKITFGITDGAVKKITEANIRIYGRNRF